MALPGYPEAMKMSCYHGYFHTSAWRETSQKAISRILHSPGPMGITSRTTIPSSTRFAGSSGPERSVVKLYAIVAFLCLQHL
jgi:hypothetical protein